MIVTSTNFGLRGLVKVSVVERGRVVREYPVQHNLILNQGLDQIASAVFAQLITFAVAGTGSTATEIDSPTDTVNIVSGSATFSQIGYLAGDASDVGKSIKLIGSGNVYRVTAFNTNTQCSVTPAVTEGPDIFNVYMTQQTGLDAEIKRTNTYLTGAPNCQTVTSGDVTTMTRTYDFSAEVGPQSYNEVGFSSSASPGSNLFSRIKLPSAVPLTAGQQLRVLYSLQITVSPTTPQVYGTSPIVGWAGATGSLQHEAVPISFINTNGGIAGSGTNTVDSKFYIGNEPSALAGFTLWISSDASALVSYGTGLAESNATASGLAPGLSSYVAGSYTLDKFGIFPVGQANATNWRCYYLGVFRDGGSNWSACRFLFDTQQTKLSTFTLTLGFRSTWNRIL